jgi:hypothetical protein
MRGPIKIVAALAFVSGFLVGCPTARVVEGHHPPKATGNSEQVAGSAQNTMSTAGPDGGTKRAAIKDVWAQGGCWGFMVEVENPDQGIFTSADLKCDIKHPPVADRTAVNVVKRSDGDLVELGVGTRLQLLMLTPDGECDNGLPGAQRKAAALIGCPGATVTIQPGASVRLAGRELSPGGGSEVTFKLDLVNGAIVPRGVKGSLKSTRLRLPR